MVGLALLRERLSQVVSAALYYTTYATFCVCSIDVSTTYIMRTAGIDTHTTCVLCVAHNAILHTKDRAKARRRGDACRYGPAHWVGGARHAPMDVSVTFISTRDPSGTSVLLCGCLCSAAVSDRARRGMDRAMGGREEGGVCGLSHPFCINR